MRALPPGAAREGIRCDQRAEVFRSALEQSEQLFRAAETIGPETQPLLLFYGLSQAGRALAAVSPSLPAAEQGRQPWHLKGHGIEANPQGPLRNISLMPPKKPNPHGLTSFAGVAQALGCEGLPISGARLGDLWASLPETRYVPLEEAPRFPALYLQAQSAYEPPLPSGWSTINLTFCPARVWEESGGLSQEERITEFLAHYPTLGEWRFLPPDGVGRQETGRRDSSSLPRTIYVPHHPNPHVSVETLLGTPYRGDVHYVLPAIEGNQRPLHPLLAWWGVLYGLASVARYEPQSWVKAINIDKANDRTANAIEHLLEMATSAIPELVTRELHRLN
ncbi:YaaC family protein [Streptomyces sp. ASQP_92]|uniref:YaaC family protein n=1 Tax=Streptomyces sp. ASQP_92 TaxID=2979116 RepID=UPI0037DA3EB3